MGENVHSCAPPECYVFILTQPQNPSFVLTSPGNVSYEDRAVPSIQSPDDVIVQVKFTGICGSDVHYWHSGRCGNFVVDGPMVLGHESAGIVHSVGNDVKTLKAGDRVALEPGIPCRRCPRCKGGSYNLCNQVKFAATPPTDGTLARYYTLPADFCYKLPQNVSLEQGALIEPLSVAVHIVSRAPVKPGQVVVVYGAGPVGLLCLAVARSFGASKTISVDVNSDRLKFAAGYAATAVFEPRKEESAEDGAYRLIAECDLGEGADVSIDATGVDVCVRQALHVLRPTGTYVQGGMGAPTLDAWPIMAIMAKEITTKTSFRYNEGDYELAIKLVDSNKVDVKPLISAKVAFTEAEQAFGDTKAAKGIKTLICGPE